MKNYYYRLKAEINGLKAIPSIGVLTLSITTTYY